MNQDAQSQNSAVCAPQTNGLAITSLVLGIIGFTCTGILTAIPAIICGHVSLSQINRSAGRESGRGMAIAGLVLGYVGVFLTTIAMVGILAGMLLPAMSQARNRAKEVQSMNNVRQIHMACLVYYDDHGVLPESLEQLVEAGHIFPDILQSPFNDDPDLDYELLLKGDFNTVDDPVDTVMIRDRDGRVVGYADGRVERADGRRLNGDCRDSSEECEGARGAR